MDSEHFGIVNIRNNIQLLHKRFYDSFLGGFLCIPVLSICRPVKLALFMCRCLWKRNLSWLFKHVKTAEFYRLSSYIHLWELHVFSNGNPLHNYFLLNIFVFIMKNKTIHVYLNIKSFPVLFWVTFVIPSGTCICI